MSSTDASNPELEALILANRNDPRGYLVYADWLQAQGDPRGQLITIQLAKWNRLFLPWLSRPELITAENELLGQYREHWVGPAAPLLRLHWRNGFVDDLTCEISETREGGLTLAGLAETLRRPAFRCLRSMNLRLVAVQPRAHLLEPLTSIPSLSPVTTLSISGPLPERRVRWVLGPMGQAFPSIRELKIDTMFDFGFDDVSLPHLRRLEVSGCEASPINLHGLGAASWPQLESLHVNFQGGSYGQATLVRRFEALFRALSKNAGLRKLHLFAGLRTELLQTLGTSPLRPQLQSFSFGPEPA